MPVQVGVLPAQQNMVQTEHRDPEEKSTSIIKDTNKDLDVVFAWSNLVSYSKKLHLRTMKPAGLPPLEDRNIQNKRTGGGKGMSGVNVNAYSFQVKQGNVMPSIS